MRHSGTIRRLLAFLRPAVRRSGTLALGSGTLLAALWLLTVTGHAPPSWIPRTVGILAAASALLWGAPRLRRAPGPLLLVLAVSFVFAYAGLAHEVGKGYYTDEGHYLHHAREVSSGKLFTRSFVYPHLTYYRDAFALYLKDLYPWAASAVCAVFGVRDPDVCDWMLLRLLTAGLGAATVVPVFFLAFRVAGTFAALLASLLVVFSAHYQEGFQVNICDVPSAFFATLSLMFVGRLLDEERTSDYLWAGLAAGCAAASKYPAGTVAVALVAVWVVHRVRRRDLRWGLLWAGLAALATFLAANPSLFVHADAAFHGPRGFFFGVRQYAQGGWLGVTPDSNALYYAGKLLESFGWPVAVLAAAGAFGLDRDARRRLALLLPFPVAFLVLLCSMNMVVLRNLFPVIPALAIFLGALASGLPRFAGARRRVAAAALAAAALALPAAAAVRQTVSLARPSTRDVAVAWVRENVPLGAGILKEAYTPDFPVNEVRTVQRRFAFRITAERFADPRFDFLLVAGSAFWRFFRHEDERPEMTAWYRRAFETHELVYEIEPGPWRRGPLLRLYRLAERGEKAKTRQVFGPDDAFVVHPSMTAPEAVRFTEAGRRAVFAATFEAGSYRVRARGELRGDGELQVRDLANAVVATAALGSEPIELDLPRRGKYFLTVVLPRGSRLRELVVVRPGAVEPPSPTGVSAEVAG